MDIESIYRTIDNSTDKFQRVFRIVTVTSLSSIIKSRVILLTCYWPAADRRWLLHRPGRRSTEESTSFRQKRVALVVLTATTDLAAEARRRRRSRGASTLLRLHPHPLRFHLSTSSLLFLSVYLMMWWRVWSIHDRALSSSGLNTPFSFFYCVPFFVFSFASSRCFLFFLFLMLSYTNVDMLALRDIIVTTPCVARRKE